MAPRMYDCRSLRCWAAFAALCIMISGGRAAAKATFVTFNVGIVAGINAADTVTGWRGDGSSFIRTVDGTVTTFVVPGASATEALRINDQGAITGFYRDGAGQAHGFVRISDGTITTFDVHNANGVGPISINNKGEVTGSYTDGTGNHGFVRTAGGRIKTFDVSGAIDTASVCINDKGVSVGYYLDSNHLTHGFLRAADGSITFFYVTGSTETLGICINKKGTATGEYGTDGEHGFIRDADGTITTFDGQDCNIFSAGINDKGMVTGSWHDRQHTGRFLGFVRKPDGTVKEFRIPNGGNSTTSVGITATGVIAGNNHDGGF